MTADTDAPPRLAHAILDTPQGESALVSQVKSLRVYLQGAQPGQGAEVQVAVVNGGLVVIAAGDVLLDRDTRGFARVRVDPT